MKHQAIFKKLYVCHEGKVTHSMYFHSQSEHSFNLFAIFYHFNLAQFLVEKQILPTSTDRKYKHWGKRVSRQLFKDHGHEIYCWQKDIIIDSRAVIACGNLYCKIALCSGTKIDSFKAVGSTRKLFQKHFYV